MCGIIGFFGKGAGVPSEDQLKFATDAMRHRGPDEEGMYYHPPIGLGFRRLSIIDLFGWYSTGRSTTSANFESN